jgi:hypothetical protein
MHAANTAGENNARPQRRTQTIIDSFITRSASTVDAFYALAWRVWPAVGKGFMLVPVMALVLTHIEVWPALQTTMLENYQARQRV